MSRVLVDSVMGSGWSAGPQIVIGTCRSSLLCRRRLVIYQCCLERGGRSVIVFSPHYSGSRFGINWKNLEPIVNHWTQTIAMLYSDITPVECGSLSFPIKINKGWLFPCQSV